MGSPKGLSLAGSFVFSITFFENPSFWLVALLNASGYLIFRLGMIHLRAVSGTLIEFVGGVLILASFILMFLTNGVWAGLILIPIFWFVVTPVVEIILESVAKRRGMTVREAEIKSELIKGITERNTEIERGFEKEKEYVVKTFIDRPPRHKRPFQVNRNAEKQNGSPSDDFQVAGLELSKRHFPILYRAYLRDPQWLEKQLRSIANAWHEGSLDAAAQALESDLEHDSYNPL